MHATLLGHRTAYRRTQRGTRDKVLIATEVFNGLGALAGGLSLMASPDGGILNMPTSYLAGSPFTDYFIPGLLLTVCVGVGMLSAAALLVMRRPYALDLAIATGAALVIFEIVEVFVIGFNPMQVLYGGLGAVVLGLGIRGWLDQKQSRQHTSL
jgi:hypothetical protein